MVSPCPPRGGLWPRCHRRGRACVRRRPLLSTWRAGRCTARGAPTAAQHVARRPLPGARPGGSLPGRSFLHASASSTCRLHLRIFLFASFNNRFPIQAWQHVTRTGHCSAPVQVVVCIVAVNHLRMHRPQISFIARTFTVGVAAPLGARAGGRCALSLSICLTNVSFLYKFSMHVH